MNRDDNESEAFWFGEALRELVAEGLAEVIGYDHGEPVYALTERGMAIDTTSAFPPATLAS